MNRTLLTRTVLSWLSPALALALTVFLFTGSIGQTQGSALSDAKAKQLIGQQPSRRAGQQMICTVSSFFSIDSNEQISGDLKIEGRGLASCKNDQGFTTEIPVSTEITAKPLGNWANAGELSFSANSSSFVIPREVGQLQDTYAVKTYGSDIEKSTYLFEGSSHDLIMDLKLSSSTDALQKLQVTGMTVRIDENAPDLE